MDITHIYVPAVTGCGLSDNVWEKNYLPYFKMLGKICAVNKIQFIILNKKNNPLDEWEPSTSQHQHWALQI